MKKEPCIKSLCLTLIILFTFVAIVTADSLTADPQPSEMVTKYRIKLNGEIIPANIEQVGSDQVRLLYNVDHLDSGKYNVFAKAGNDSGGWSKWSDEFVFYRGVPTPQNIGLYCSSENPHRIPQETLSLYYFSSEELIKHNRPAINILDGKKATIWSASFSAKHPHEVQIDLGKAYQISGMYILPRQDAGIWGAIKSYEIYISMDGKDWIKTKTGKLLLNKDEQLMEFEGISAKYISLVCLSEHSSKTRTSIAEINVLGY